MTVRPWPWLATVALLLPTSLHAQGPATAPQELVRQLGNGDYARREGASRALDRLGAQALPALRAARTHPEAEVRRRARALIQRIEERETEAELLRPSRVRLHFTKTPLGEALRKVEAQTGLRLRAPSSEELRKRVIDVDTGNVPVWEALDRFCCAAGLAEKLLAFDAKGQATEQLPSGEIALVDRSDGQESAADLGRSLRVRLYTPLPSARERRDAPICAVEVVPEPRLDLLEVREVRFTSILDAEGRPWRAAGVTARDVRLLGLQDQFLRDRLGRYRSPRHGVVCPVSLPELEPDPGARFREIRGQFRARFRVPEPLVAVERVLASNGTSHTGPSGVALTVLASAQDDAGELRLRVRVERLDTLPEPEPHERVVRLRPGVVAVRGPADVALDRLELRDGGGRLVRRTGATYRQEPGSTTAIFELTYQPQSGQTMASRLTLTNPRVVTLTVPFVVRDVPRPK